MKKPLNSPLTFIRPLPIHLVKKAISSLFFAVVVVVATQAQSAGVISWSDSNGNTLGATSVAGLVAVTNWNNANPGNNAVINSLRDSSNNVTTAGFTIGGTFGGWGITSITGSDSDGTYNRTMLAGYANTANSASGAPEHLAITGIPYSLYTIIAYFSSDTTNRLGTTTCGATRYYFTTLGPWSVNNGNGTGTTNAAFIQTTDTTGANPAANCAIFTNLSGASQTLVLSITNGGGLAGFQIVQQTNVTLTLTADTTVSPSTNVYVGGTVTLSASFSGNPPPTNQWEVNTGSGFVAIPGATNSTLTLTNVQLTNAAAYALFAFNLAGSSNSTPITLNVLTFPTNNLSIDVQFIGSWLGSGTAPTQVGAAIIGADGDVWNTVNNPTGGTTPAGLARGTNLVLFDTGNIITPITMDYVGDYVFNGTAFGASNPFAQFGSPVANLMSGYMGSVTQPGGGSGDTNTITLHNLVPGVYDIYLYVCGRTDGQGRIDVLFANDQSAVCGPNNGSFTLTSGQNYVHLTPTVTTNGVLSISYYGTTDSGQGLLNGFQLNGPSTNVSIAISSDTTCDSPLNDYVGRTVRLTASFAGFPTPTLQWEVDKGSGYMPVSADATNSTLILSNMQTTDSGNYALFATNAAGNLNSTPLALNVQPLPSSLAISAQFDGTTFTGTHASPQVGSAAIGGGSDYWNPVSNPNPVGSDTNSISGSVVLTDVNNYGTPLTLSYTGDRDYNNGANTPFNGSDSPAANLMQASLLVLNSNTGTATFHGLSAGVYDLYLYSCAANNQQDVVTRFSANDSYDICGPNNTNSALILRTNYVHLTPTVTANGLLNISFSGRSAVTVQANLNGIQLIGPGATLTAPLASFSVTRTNAYASQIITFLDSSTGNISSWLWDFGDGNTLNTNSSANITHAYSTPGAYTVSLIVSGAAGSATNIQTAYIQVSFPPTFGVPVNSSGSLILAGTGGIAGDQYRILSTTNLALPLASWTPVWTNVFAPDGSYSYTNSPLTNSASFFELVTP